MLEEVCAALREMRPPFVPYEADLHALVGERLRESGLPCEHEARLGPGCRIDYLVGDVGVEIKKGKPAPRARLPQLARYARCEGLSALVVVTQRRVALPPSLYGKPLRQLPLWQLWGVSLP